MKLFRSILSIVFAFLVLVSSTNFMVGMHLCAGRVQDVALFTKADPCAMERSLPPCAMLLKSHCCEDETIVHHAEELKASVAQIDLVSPSSIDIAFPDILISEIVPSAPVSRAKYFNYDPPLRSYDLSIEHQVFLI